MKFIATYFCIGTLWTMVLMAFGDLIDKFREKGFGIGWIIFGCIMAIAIWPYAVYIAIKEVYQTTKD